MNRDPEKNGVLATCEELGIGFVPWGPLGMGYLSGKIDAHTTFDPKTDFRSGFERFSPENLAANKPLVDLQDCVHPGAGVNSGGLARWAGWDRAARGDCPREGAWAFESPIPVRIRTRISCLRGSR